jgi:hypothetical protein
MKRFVLNRIEKGMIVEVKCRHTNSWWVGKVFTIDRKNKFLSLRTSQNTLGFVCQFSIFDSFEWIDVKTGEFLSLKYTKGRKKTINTDKEAGEKKNGN